MFRAGVVGISLAMAGAKVTLTDLPHITPLTSQNLALNADRHFLDAQASTAVLTPICVCLKRSSAVHWPPEVCIFIGMY